MTDIGFPFGIGDRVLSTGIRHWTNDEPLTIDEIFDDTFAGHMGHGRGRFEYSKGGSNGLRWVAAP